MKSSAAEIEKRIKASEKAQKIAYRRQLDSQLNNHSQQRAGTTPTAPPSGGKGGSYQAPFAQRGPPINVQQQLKQQEADRKAQYRKELEAQMAEQKLRKIQAEMEYGGGGVRNLEQELKQTKKELKSMGHNVGPAKQTLKSMEKQLKSDKKENQATRDMYNARNPMGMLGGATGGSGEPLRGPDGQIISDYSRMRASTGWKGPVEHTSVKEALFGEPEIAQTVDKTYSKPPGGRSTKQDRQASAGRQKKERAQSGTRKKTAGGSKDRKPSSKIGSKNGSKTNGDTNREWWERQNDRMGANRPPSRQIPTLKRLGFDPNKSINADSEVAPETMIENESQIHHSTSRYNRPAALPRTPPDQRKILLKDQDDLPQPPPEATYDNFERLESEESDLEDSDKPLANSSELVKIASRPSTVGSKSAKQDLQSRGKSAASRDSKKSKITQKSTSDKSNSSSENEDDKTQPYTIMHRKPKKDKKPIPDSAKNRSTRSGSKPESAKNRKTQKSSVRLEEQEDPDKVVNQFLEEHKRKGKITSGLEEE